MFQRDGRHAWFRAAGADPARWLELADAGVATDVATTWTVRGRGAVCAGGYRAVAGVTGLGMVVTVGQRMDRAQARSALAWCSKCPASRLAMK